MRIVGDLMSEEQFFFGEYTHALDSQNRVAVPREWRRKDGQTRLILFPGSDNDLLLFPFASFQDFMIQARKKSFTNRRIRDLLAQLGARTRECTCDKQGRIKVPSSHLAMTDISNQVTLIGAFTHIKLCSPEAWQKSQSLNGCVLDELEELNADNSNSEVAQLLQSLVHPA